MGEQPFWERKSLAEMTREEWEALCDGCGRCCIVTLEDDETPEVLQETSLSCRLFDPENRRCTCYYRRTELVPECVELRPDNVADLGFMPDTCAYRRLAEGKGLANWHPLITGDPNSVEDAGIAISRELTNEQGVREEDFWRYVTGERPRR
ncbi:MAG: YcgN family cysteine cluster protein [Pseudomonadota bacterium]